MRLAHSHSVVGIQANIRTQVFLILEAQFKGYWSREEQTQLRTHQSGGREARWRRRGSRTGSHLGWDWEDEGVMSGVAMTRVYSWLGA